MSHWQEVNMVTSYIHVCSSDPERCWISYVWANCPLKVIFEKKNSKSPVGNLIELWLYCKSKHRKKMDTLLVYGWQIKKIIYYHTVYIERVKSSKFDLVSLFMNLLSLAGPINAWWNTSSWQIPSSRANWHYSCIYQKTVHTSWDMHINYRLEVPGEYSSTV